MESEIPVYKATVDTGTAEDRAIGNISVRLFVLGADRKMSGLSISGTIDSSKTITCEPEGSFEITKSVRNDLHVIHQRAIEMSRGYTGILNGDNILYDLKVIRFQSHLGSRYSVI